MRQLLVLEHRLSEVQAFQRRLEGFLREAGYSEDLVHDLSLVSEEVLVNIIHHGEAGDSAADRRIQVLLGTDEAGLVHLEFRDDNCGFNPLQVQERDPGDERAGGWGIPLLKTLADHVEYSRRAGHNVLHLVRGERSC